MRSIKNIVIIYPSFERGGVENILLNLVNFFCKKKKYLFNFKHQQFKKK